MSLIRCPFCGAFVTDRDAVCWHCEGTLKEEGTAAAPVHTKGFRHITAEPLVQGEKADNAPSFAAGTGFRMAFAGHRMPKEVNSIEEKAYKAGGFRRTTVASSAVNVKASELLSESSEATPVAACLTHGFRYTTPSQTPAEIPDDSQKVCMWAGGFRKTSSASSPAAGNVNESMETKENDPFLDTLPSIDISEYDNRKASNPDIKGSAGKSAIHIQADKAPSSSLTGDGDDAESEVYVKHIHRRPAEDSESAGVNTKSVSRHTIDREYDSGIVDKEPVTRSESSDTKYERHPQLPYSDETSENRFMIFLAAVIGVIIAALLLFFVFPRV